MYDLMTTLLSGSAIWAYLGQDYDFNTSACSRRALKALLSINVNNFCPIISAFPCGMVTKYSNLQFLVANIEDSSWLPVSYILSIQKSHIWIPALLKPHKCIPGAQFFIFKWGVFPIITAFYLPVTECTWTSLWIDWKFEI